MTQCHLKVSRDPQEIALTGAAFCLFYNRLYNMLMDEYNFIKGATGCKSALELCDLLEE